MPSDSHPGVRIQAAIDALGTNQAKIARQIGVKPQQLNQVVTGERPGTELLERVASALGVDPVWLRTGADALAPAWAKVGPLSSDVAGMNLVGVVAAGDDAEVAEWVQTPPTPFPLKASWRVVQVQGWSAYPVVYPEQFVITDEARATRPDIMTDVQRDDLHDNIVICQVSGSPPTAYLKRFCHAPGAPSGFILASVDSGRGSPFIDPQTIIVIEPVVGVLFEDPRLPRRKRGKIKRRDGR